MKTDTTEEDLGSASRLRANELIDMMLCDKADEADVMLSTVPDERIRALVVALVPYAAEALRNAYGVPVGRMILSGMREQEARA
jgi:hypothetical protein